ncbi:hypothetical protein RFI_39249, partial [Reticulomyxa filosa]
MTDHTQQVREMERRIQAAKAQQAQLLVSCSEQTKKFDKEIKEKCDVLETMAKRCETIKLSHENDLQQKKAEHLLLAKQVEAEGTSYLPYVSFVQKKKKKKQSQFCAKFKEELKDMESLRVLLYSPTGEGKSTLGNRILGDESPDGNKGPFE